MKQLGGLDASFLYMETPTTFGHVSGEQPLTQQELLQQTLRRLAMNPVKGMRAQLRRRSRQRTANSTPDHSSTNHAVKQSHHRPTRVRDARCIVGVHQGIEERDGWEGQRCRDGDLRRRAARLLIGAQRSAKQATACNCAGFHPNRHRGRPVDQQGLEFGIIVAGELMPDVWHLADLHIDEIDHLMKATTR